MSATALRGRLPRPTLPRLRRAAAEPYARGHLYVSPDTGETWALYRLPGVDWTSAGADRRLSLLNAEGHAWGGLVGHKIWLRVIPEEFPTAAFLGAQKTAHPGAGPAFLGAIAAQAAAIHGSDTRVHRAALGVRVARTAVAREHLPLLLGETTPPPRMMEFAALRAAVAKADTAVADGFGGAAMTEAQVVALCDAAVRFGLPTDTTSVHASTEPFQATTQVTGLSAGRAVTAHVQMLRVDEVADRDGTVGFPWLAWAQTQPGVVAAVACGEVLPAASLVKEATRAAREARSIDSADTDEGYDSRGEVTAGGDRAVEVRDDVAAGGPLRHRFRGQVKFAVAADTPEAAAAAGVALAATAASTDEAGLALSVGWGQHADWCTLAPGARWDFTGHVTQQSTACLAASLPRASQAGGDSIGMLLGAIGGSRDVFVHDPHGREMPNRPRVHAVVAEPGAGKSTLMGAVADYLVQAGVRTTVNDPSGNLARLAQLPWLAADARVVEITAAAHPGILMPHALVPDPSRSDYATDAEWQGAMRQRAAERANLAVDMTLGCLPWSVVDSDRGTVAPAVEAAVAHVGSGYGVHSREIIDALAAQGGVGRELAGFLRARAGLGDGQLVFPDRDVDPPRSALTSSAALTVVTTPGLSVPPAGLPRSSWQREHHESIPILLGASRFAALSIWADKGPKGHFDDELGITGGSTSFGSFLTRAAYDSRKWGASVWLAFQTMHALAQLPDQEVDSLIGPRFVGRTSGRTADAAAATLLGETGGAWRPVLPDLADGEFVVQDWRRRQRRTQVDQGWWRPELRRALDTTPAAVAAPVEGLFGALR